MSIKNRIFNKLYRVKRVRQKGCENVGRITRWNKFEDQVVKYDWSKPFKFTTRTYSMKDFSGGVNKLI